MVIGKGKIMENNRLVALQARNKKNKSIYVIEMTDTFGGDANYCWVRRYKTESVSIVGAVTKLSKRYGGRFRKTYGDNMLARYDAVGATICVFVEEVDKDDESLVSGDYVSI